ncbi:U32 family peptidase [Diplocloster modestus]|uniref:U32 family peptidase n=1 Tax=Diplocloster modestus TaxID=2850322 RepID=A0ABS6KCB2_9FIRM|nr:U32 family peptidase [Diplocloster modestus]MBU9728162.1 U32 family peptidase [Diplocloster modestus]
MDREQIELLAPAGSYDSFRAAMQAGADAVYMGGSKFGARAYANNPQQDSLLQALREAHLRGKKIYLTVNTLLKERELKMELYDYLRPYYEEGLDAVIVQDVGVLSFIREYFPDLPVHASTQMTITGPLGAEFLEKEGVSRVVPARELSLQEIRMIREQTSLEIETFVHGALCYCYSGQCLLSSILGGRSGNRGRCAQPCRLPYELTGGAVTGSKAAAGRGKQAVPVSASHLISMKDLCTIDLLPDILDAGVTSLKIEGRMKQPEYVAGVVRIYRKYLDLFLEKGARDYRVSEEDRRELECLFSREGFTKGYYQQHNGRKMLSLNNAGGEIRMGNLMETLRREYVENQSKEKINGMLILSKENHAKLCVNTQSASVTVTGACAEQAVQRPIQRDQVEKQLRKTGNTPFLFGQLQIEMEEDLFLPLQAVNELRRNALEALERELLAPFRRTPPVSWEKENAQRGMGADASRAQEKALCIRAYVEETQQLEALVTLEQISDLYVNYSLFPSILDEKAELADLKRWTQEVHRYKKKCYLVLPVIFRESLRQVFEGIWDRLMETGIDGIVIRNYEEYEFLERHSFTKPVVTDANVYTFNKRSRAFWAAKGCGRDTAPVELNLKELRARGCEGSEIIAYGHLPMMVSAQCLLKTADHCTHVPETRRLKDRYQKYFYVKNFCMPESCYNVIYNSVPLVLLDQDKDIKSLGPAALRLDFTVETGAETLKTAKLYIDRYIHGIQTDMPWKEFTRGHFKRGVE